LEEADLAVKLFGVQVGGNFDEPGRGRSGGNILHLPKPLDEVASESQLTVDALIAKLGRIQQALFKAREKRVRPARDDKILADWNGLMVAALARGSQVFGDRKYLEAAINSANFIMEKMRDDDGKLCHRYAKGEKAIDGFLDDYAFLAWGFIEIYEANFEEKHLQAALELTEKMIALFWDEENGGFYFTSKASAEGILRRKEVYDGAVPSGNSVAMLNLLRLAVLTGNSAYEDLANRMSRAFSAEAKETPAGHTFLLLGVDFAVGPAYNVVLVGDLKERDTIDMLEALRWNHVPNIVVSLRQPSKPGFGYEKIEGKATAYVCRGRVCLPPTNEVEKMLELLGLPRRG
jgi:hypothetical protein